MIQKLHLLFCQTLLQASGPLFLYSIIRCIETTLQYESLLLQSSKDILLGLYSNYPLFMLAMLSLACLIRAFKRLGLSKETEPVHKGNDMITEVIKKCLCLTFLYACFHLTALSFDSLPEHKLSEGLSLNTISGLKEVPRILEAEGGESYLMKDNFSTKEEEPKVESFDVGKIIGSRPIRRSAMTISKDGKTVFLIEEEHGVLTIVDISDNQNPRMLGSLALKGDVSMARSLLLSANEKILYTSVATLLEIIDISNLKSPVLLSSVYDSDLLKLRDQVYLYSFLSIKVSMALSGKEKALYVGGPHVLQIFSVENPKQVQLVFSSAKKEPDHTIQDTVFGTSVATSADRKTLYFANGTVEVYDISLNPLKPVLESTFKGSSFISSLLLGKDNKILYAAGRGDKKTIILERIAIEEKSPFLKSVETFNLGVTSASPPAILEKSLSERTLFLFTTQLETVMIFSSLEQIFRGYNLETREMLDLSKDLFPVKLGTLRAIPNTKNFVISNEGQLNIVSFFYNYPNPHSFALSNNMIGVYNSSKGVIQFTVSSSLGIDRLYTITLFEMKYYFNIVEMSDKRFPKTLASFILDIEARFLSVVESANRAFAVSENKTIQVLNFSNFSKIQNLGLTQLEFFDFNKFYPLNDGKTVLTSVMDKSNSVAQLQMLDFSDLSSIKIIAEEKINKTSNNSMIQVSSKGITFLCLRTEVLIYNLSAPASSRRIASFDLPSKDPASQYLVKCHLLEKRNILFIETNRQDMIHNFSIFNVSDITSPKMLTTFRLPKLPTTSASIPTRISSDASKVYFWGGRHILVIDLSDLQSPVIVGQIPVSLGFDWAENRFYLSGDNKFGYFVDQEKIRMVDLRIQYSLFLTNSNFTLGKKYAANFMLLKLNFESHFQHFAEENYKIIKLSLSKISLDEGSEEAQTKLLALPDWITLDRENSLLNIESKKERDLGNYTLHSACSLKVPFEAFNFIGNSTNAEDLVATLVSLGFLDNERFLTSSFGAEENFLIQSQYSDHKERIYRTLKKFSFETFTPFRLLPSLDLKVNSRSFSIMTPSLDVIKVDIRLTYNLTENEKENPQFLLRNYGSIVPLITAHKTHLRIEGLLNEVNMALEKLVINNKSLLCDGEIIVTDNLNQPLVKTFTNITKYFTSNKPPKVNLTLQSQIDMVPIYTGEFVTIILNQRTFIDDNAESLTYKVVMNTPQRHEKPSWLVLSSDLVMKIMAPEQLFSREIKFLLIVENEFEEFEVPFTLKIQLSPMYVLKLLIQLSPWILTIIGLYIKANKIYNILAQKWYKHPKEFFVEIEREIGPEVIPPIWFIAGEKKEVKLILKEICRKVSKDLGCSQSDKQKLVDYFWNSEILDAEKLRQAIEEAVPAIERRRQLKLYKFEGKSRKVLINQMIENQFVLWKLDLKQEKMTKNVSNKMKNSWIELVKWDNSKNQFVIEQEKFDETFGGLRGEVSSLKESTESIDLTLASQDKSELLLKKKDSRININLLKKSLLVLAFKNHSLDLKGINVYIKVKQREESNCLKRILREDLNEVSFSVPGNIGYGMMNTLDGDRLDFLGMPRKHLEGETLIIQITNSHERILKELWIHGSGHKNEIRPEIMQNYGIL